MMHSHTPGSQPTSGISQGRLKYASPQDLPSYPSLGLRKDDSAASAAASLGWASQRKPSAAEQPTRKPSTPASASAAALLAHDSRILSSSLSPVRSNASLKAATFAVGQSPKQVRPPPPPPLQAMSSGAATQAFRTDKPSSKPSPMSPDFKEINRRGSILAAAGAMSQTSRRRRAQSSPLISRSLSGPQSDAAASALSAATLAHRPSTKSPHPSKDAGAVPYTTMPRSMFTSIPSVAPEVEDQTKNNKLHSDAIAMARKLYTQQQAMIDATRKIPGHNGSSQSSPEATSLQDAAYKLAQQRLSKIDADSQKTRDYQNYYCATSPTQRRLSSRTVLRSRASSDSDILMQDRHQSEQIRQQMSIFNNKLSKVDEQKRTQDRQSLLALAQKNVQTQLAGMDRQITHETGRISRASKTNWDSNVMAAAHLRSDTRIGANHRGQVDIGGGKFMDMKEVEAIASKRMKPELDKIYAKAEQERERQDKLKEEQEARKRELEEKKIKEKEKKAAHKKNKAQEKQEERLRKEEGTAAETEQKKQTKDEKRISRPFAAAARVLRRQPQTEIAGEARDSGMEDISSAISSRPSTPMSSQSHGTSPVGSPKSPHGKMKTWLKMRFRRPRGPSNASAASRDDCSNLSDSRPSTQGSGFIGGAALARSIQSLSGRDDSMMDVAMAGRDNEFLGEGESEIPLGLPGKDRPVSPLTSSSSSSSDIFASISEAGENDVQSRSRAESNISGLSPAPPCKSPVINPLAMHPSGSSVTGGGSGGGSASRLVGSSSRDSRFQEMMD